MDFESVLDDLYDLSLPFGFAPDMSDEAEQLIAGLVEAYEGPESEFADWYRSRVAGLFRSESGPPDWLQDPEWPLVDGKPMLFVGHLDLQRGAHGYRFFVFWAPEDGARRVVIQID